MDQPEQNVVTNTQLPQSQVQMAPDAAALDAPGATIFDAKKVSCYYGSFRAVTDVSLSIYEHEITAFIGPSGCGKTTVLRTLNRMNDLVPGAHVDGDVHYRGASLYAKDVSPIAVRRRIGMVFQKPSPLPEVDLRQHRLRAAHQRYSQQGQAERDRRTFAAPGPRCGTR